MDIQLKHFSVWMTKLHSVCIQDVQTNEVSLYANDNG